MDKLRENINVAYFKATGQSGGWELFISMFGTNTPAEIARKFEVAEKTSYRWHEQYRKLEV